MIIIICRRHFHPRSWQQAPCPSQLLPTLSSQIATPLCSTTPRGDSLLLLPVHCCYIYAQLRVYTYGCLKHGQMHGGPAWAEQCSPCKLSMLQSDHSQVSLNQEHQAHRARLKWKLLVTVCFVTCRSEGIAWAQHLKEGWREVACVLHIRTFQIIILQVPCISPPHAHDLLCGLHV